MRLRTRLRILLGLLLLAISASGLLILFYKQPGYVLIAFDRFRYESSLWFFLALIGGIWLVIWLLRLTIHSLLITGGWLNPWSKRARLRRAEKAQQRGLLAFAEGYFERALPQLKRAATSDPLSLQALLAAARAAQQLGDNEQSTELLEQARQKNPEHALAIDLVQADLQYQRGELSAACTTLQRLHQQYPHHEHLLRELKKLLEQQQDWLALQTLLPKLQKHGLLSEHERLTYEQRAACLRLEQMDSEQALDNLWRELPKPLRGQAELLISYSEQLARLGAADKAEQQLSKAIKRHYDGRLVACYGKLQTSDPQYQLKTAELWLKNQPIDNPLLLALARLAHASGLADKARTYYEAIIAQQAGWESCVELAQLLSDMGEKEHSNARFIQALGLLKGDSKSESEPAPSALVLQKTTS